MHIIYNEKYFSERQFSYIIIRVIPEGAKMRSATSSEGSSAHDWSEL